MTKREELIRFELIENGKYFTAFELVKMHGITYDAICQIKLDMENAEAEKLKHFLSQKLVDKFYGEPFRLDVILEYCNIPYTQQNFKKALRAGKLKRDYILQVIEIIENEYAYPEDHPQPTLFEV